MALIQIDGKPIEKLIEVVSNAFGTLYKPRAIRKEADARAYEIEVIERAKAMAVIEGKDLEAWRLEIVGQRMLYQQTKKQNNIDNVIEVAAEQLRDEACVSEEPVNEDWTTRFFNIAENIGDEDMQKLWGRILAGEVKRPNSYSLRALEVLKNLTKNEAELFDRFCKLTLRQGEDRAFIFNPDKLEFLKESYQIKYDDLLLLDEIGLIVNKDLGFYFVSGETKVALIYGEYIILMNTDDSGKIMIPTLSLTKIGYELSKLVSQTVDLKYLNKMAEFLKDKTTSISYSKIIAIEGTQIEYEDNLTKLPAC